CVAPWGCSSAGGVPDGASEFTQSPRSRAFRIAQPNYQKDSIYLFWRASRHIVLNARPERLLRLLFLRANKPFGIVITLTTVHDFKHRIRLYFDKNAEKSPRFLNSIFYFQLIPIRNIDAGPAKHWFRRIQRSSTELHRSCVHAPCEEPDQASS